LHADYGMNINCGKGFTSVFFQRGQFENIYLYMMVIKQISNYTFTLVSNLMRCYDDQCANIMKSDNHDGNETCEKTYDNVNDN
jgi:hypothetical protein